jgi:hypothetical protein
MSAFAVDNNSPCGPCLENLRRVGFLDNCFLKCFTCEHKVSIVNGRRTLESTPIKNNTFTCSVAGCKAHENSSK